MPKSWSLASLSAASFVLIGADAPTGGASVFEPLAEAGIACAEATQTGTVSTSAVEKHGWALRFAPSPRVSQFARADARFTIAVFQRPPVCVVNWSVHSSSGRAAIFAAAEDAVSSALAHAFGKKYQRLDHRSDGQKELQQFAAGGSEVVVSVEPIGAVDINDLVRVQAMNLGKVAKSASK